MKLAYDLFIPSGDKERNLPPLIMLHGMLDSRKTWNFIAPRIADRTGRRVYALDARNHGESPWSDQFTLDINIEDVIEFFTDHNISRASIVGHSMGGRSALALALNKAELVDKIVAVDINLFTFEPSETDLIVQVVEILKESLDQVPPEADEYLSKMSIVEYVFSQILGPIDKRTPKQRSRSYDLSMLPVKRVGNGYCWQANLDVIKNTLTSDNIRQDLSGVFTGDALFLYGTKSFMQVDMDSKIPRMFPRSTLVGIERASHLLHCEFPERFIDEVSSFLNSGVALRAKY